MTIERAREVASVWHKQLAVRIDPVWIKETTEFLDRYHRRIRIARFDASDEEEKQEVKQGKLGL